MSIPYANTVVPIKETKSKINEMLESYGIHSKDIYWINVNGREVLKFVHEFEIAGKRRLIPFSFTVPAIIHRGEEIEKAGYRLLYWYLKNKLLAVKYGMETMEKEMMAHIQIGTATIGEKLELSLQHAPALENFDPFNGRSTTASH